MRWGCTRRVCCFTELLYTPDAERPASSSEDESLAIPSRSDPDCGLASCDTAGTSLGLHTLETATTSAMQRKYSDVDRYAQPAEEAY